MTTNAIEEDIPLYVRTKAYNSDDRFQQSERFRGEC